MITLKGKEYQIPEKIMLTGELKTGELKSSNTYCAELGRNCGKVHCRNCLFSSMTARRIEVPLITTHDLFRKVWKECQELL